MIRIAITGPESCGKTSLAEDLANHYRTTCIPEFARAYLMKTNGKYTQEDLDTIAKGQLESIENFNSGEILISDTEMLVMFIWSSFVFGNVSPYIQSALSRQQFDLYILCDTDVPWVFDPLRENEFDREELFHRYYKKIRELKYPFILVKGSPENRLQQAVSVIDTLMKKIN
jgi:NadR type nicotinamide-nucleotide adenylyltransferase